MASPSLEFLHVLWDSRKADAFTSSSERSFERQALKRPIHNGQQQKAPTKEVGPGSIAVLSEVAARAHTSRPSSRIYVPDDEGL